MAKKLIWDLSVRIVHWALVVLIFGSWYTVEVAGDMDTHMLIGQVILSLVLFRIVWGFVGTRYARFSSFWFKPREIVASARSLFSRAAPVYAGLNPVGGISVFLMLALALLQTTTGLFATDGDFYAGPLNDLISGAAGNGVTDYHELNFNILLLAICLHVVAVLYYLLFKRQNLIAPMIVGGKPDEAGNLEAIPSSRPWLALGIYLGVAAAIYAVLHLR